MKHFIDMEFEGIDLEYGYNIDMHVDEDTAVCFVSTVYGGRKLVAKCQRDMPSIPFEARNEETIFSCLYSGMRELQRMCERQHEGC